MPRYEGKSELVMYKGIRFRRYPQSPDWTSRSYFRPMHSEATRGVDLLHREIWKDAHGPIPEGYEIHHKDGNPLNNAIDNLECLTPAEHAQRHSPAEDSERMRQLRENMNKARVAASAWHKSAAGREWHRALAQMANEARYQVTATCGQCGKEYETDNVSVSHSRFCSPACRAAARRKLGVDLVTGVCAMCGRDFRYDRTQPRQFCSRRCSNGARQKREERICPTCGQRFAVRPSERQRYCTPACAYTGMYGAGQGR